MESNWAADNLRTIRTLMERAAVYRRALGPIMLAAGGIGLAAGIAGFLLSDPARATGLGSSTGFAAYWLGIAALVLVAAFLKIRRQALKDSESFWSPPTRRVVKALLPALFTGLIAGLAAAASNSMNPFAPWGLMALWMGLYGCALHAAGFFMPRGIGFFGWMFIGLSAAVLFLILQRGGAGGLPPARIAHLWMAGGFGGLHLAYGLYLLLTEKNAA